MLMQCFLLLNLIATVYARSTLHGPEWKNPHPNRIEGETMYAFREFDLSIRDTNKYGDHSSHQLAHRFDRLKHPHSNADLWHFVKDTCEKTWSVTKPDDHHFAATVDIHERRVRCWAGYHNSDVESWQHLEGFVTFLPAIEALGDAPDALWYTDKWDVHHHGPFYNAEGHNSEDL